MRIESPLLAAVPETAGTTAPELTAGLRRRRPDRVELLVLAALALFSLWTVALDVHDAITRGIVWTGTDGFFIVDQMQYLSWIQSAAHHLLVANLFVLRDTPSDYFQPAVLLSGIVTAAGVAPWLALLLWKPVAVLATFMAMRALAYRLLPGTGQRRAAILLGLFFASFSSVYGQLGVVGDMMPGWLSWGYPFGLIAVALIVFGFLGYDRARAESRVVWAPGLLAGLSASLHPWQGETFILLIVMAEAVRWREHRRLRDLRLPVLSVVLCGIPLAYYLALGHLDLSWGLARQASKHSFPLTAIAIGIAPLALVAALAYRERPKSFLELILRLWPLAALLIWVLSATALSATPLHAFNGITFPLGVLAVLGVSRIRRRIPAARFVTVLALAAATIPANAYLLSIAHQYTAPAQGNANFITRDERAAIDYLRRDPDDGGVLTQFYLGEAIPGRTGRKTLVGDCLWSQPRCMPRSLTADALFTGAMTQAQARRFVTASGARFLLASCNATADLRPLLGPLIIAVHHFGCATVYDIGPAAKATGPLAELSRDAAVRAARRQ
ncbi:MAG TPA: hypothetical protein VFN55_12985 [Solirubrobacteraceae bacterium]|nr:hypothetical protein [Solirubrobacteraceae bacterium]